MTTDCSLNYKFSTWKLQAQNMLRTSVWLRSTCKNIKIAGFQELTKKLSWQWAHTTRHMPGTLGMGACGGPEGAKLITRLQLGLGHAIRTLVFLQISKQLHGHLTYLRPGGAFLMGVASLQEGHFTTCCSLFPEMSIIPWKKNLKNIGST